MASYRPDVECSLANAGMQVRRFEEPGRQIWARRSITQASDIAQASDIG